MAEVIDGYVYENIANLQEINEISPGEYLIVETQDGTRIINFENFLIGIDNITFGELITQNSTDIDSLSAVIKSTNSELTGVQSVLNGIMTVGYTLSGAADGVTFATTEYALPVNFIQANTIDSNLANAPSTLNGITSGSNIINLNPGSYQVTFAAGFSGGRVVVDLYDNTNNQVLLTSDYSANPTIQGIIALLVRSDLVFRAYTDTSRALGTRTAFYVDGLWQNPLKASFQYLSASAVTTRQSDQRT